VCIVPPSMDTLEQRLRRRATETEEKIQVQRGSERHALASLQRC
jgi:guanylate kinase